MNYYLIFIVVGILAMIAMSLTKFFKLDILIKSPEEPEDYGGGIEEVQSPYPKVEPKFARFIRQYRFTGNRCTTKINK